MRDFYARFMAGAYDDVGDRLLLVIAGGVLLGLLLGALR